MIKEIALILWFISSLPVTTVMGTDVNSKIQITKRSTGYIQVQQNIISKNRAMIHRLGIDNATKNLQTRVKLIANGTIKPDNKTRNEVKVTDETTKQVMRVFENSPIVKNIPERVETNIPDKSKENN